MSQKEGNALRDVKCIILDVDGVLTDGTFFIDATGRENKSFHTQDGLGIILAQRSNIMIAVITGRKSEAVAQRMAELEVTLVFQGQKNKTKAFEQICSINSVMPNQIAYIGDDLPDLEIMKRVGVSVAVSNAVDQVKKSADVVLKRAGGEGAVREFIDMLLASKH